MKVKYTTERKTGLVMPGFSKVKEEKSFNLNFQQLTFRKILYGIFCLMIYFSIGSFSDFINDYGKVETRLYTQPLAFVDSAGNVEFNEEGFNSYRVMNPPVPSLTSTVQEINDFIIGFDMNGAGKLSFEDWMIERFPQFAKWQTGSFEDEDWWGFALNRIQRLIYSIVEFIGRFFYTLYYRLLWIFDMLFDLL